MIVKLSLGVNGYTSSDGSAPLYVKVSAGEKKKYYPIGIKVQKNQWDSNNQILTRDHPQAIDFNPKLFNIIGTVKGGLYGNSNYEVQKAIDTIFYGIIAVTSTTSSSEENGTFVTDYYKRYKEFCEQGKIKKKRSFDKMEAGSIKAIDTNLKRFIAYEKYKNRKLSFQDITQDWQHDFVQYLRHTYDSNNKSIGLADNSINSTISCIKKMLKYAIKEKVATNEIFSDFDALPRHPIDSIVLSKEEIFRIRELDLSAYPNLQGERERFSLAYDFCLRFSDSLRVNPMSIYLEEDQPMFRMITKKTRAEVIIPINEMSYNLLKKENFSITSRLLTTTNNRLQKLGELAGIDNLTTITEFRGGKWNETTFKKYELITSHVTRRSAATHLYQETGDLELVRQFGGWKSLQMLQKYLKIEALDNAKKMAALPRFKKAS